MNRRKIAIFTGSRAEYGLQLPIIRAVAADDRLRLHLIVGGSHLQQKFGNTESEIQSDGFTVDSRLEIEASGGSRAFTSRAIASTISGVAEIFEQVEPDLTVIYGDRFESFAAVIAASQMNLPVAHVEGGDYTEGGALDDSVRHAMTKLAHLHFVTNKEAEQRVLLLGEEPWRVSLVGLPSLDLIAAGDFSTPLSLQKEFGLDLRRPILLFCQHSVTTEFDQVGQQIEASVGALRRLVGEGWQLVITYPNNDAGGLEIINVIERLRGSPGVHVIKSLGRKRFHGMLNLIGRVGMGCFVGNSSALVKESSSFGCPAVNVGSRQRGRLRGDNVIDVNYDESEIYRAAYRSVSDAEWRTVCGASVNPYSFGGAGKKISDVLATIPLDSRLLQKRMSF
jgi:UDP-hydrolysing UDP-N-acetyl-D-glucosamine 2-epimerase